MNEALSLWVQEGPQSGHDRVIIIVALIAVAVIGPYSLFGKTVRAQSGAMAAALGGDADGAKDANEAGNKSSTKPAELGSKDRGLDDFTADTGAKK